MSPVYFRVFRYRIGASCREPKKPMLWRTLLFEWRVRRMARAFTLLAPARARTRP